MTNEYKPDTVSHPGETLREALEEMGIDPLLLDIYSPSRERLIDVQRILDGKTRITPDMAIQLSTQLKVPADFWIERQRLYDEWKEKK